MKVKNAQEHYFQPTGHILKNTRAYLCQYLLRRVPDVMLHFLFASTVMPSQEGCCVRHCLTQQPSPIYFFYNVSATGFTMGWGLSFSPWCMNPNQPAGVTTVTNLHLLPTMPTHIEAFLPSHEATGWRSLQDVTTTIQK